MKILKEGLGPFPKGEIIGEDGNPKEVILDDEMNSVEGTDREKKIEDLISRWDTSGLTKEFTAQLMALIDEVGWDNSNPFLNWLQVANNKNIQYLDRTSSKALIKALNEDDMKQTHLVNDNNLFSGNPKEFEYKLNLIRILEDPKEASKFKNDSGETPRIDMIMEKGKFVDASEMKLRMDQFAADESDIDKEREKQLDYGVWAQTIGKSIKGKEIEDLLNRVLERDKKAGGDGGRGNKNTEFTPLINYLNSIKRDKSKSASFLDNFQVKSTHNWDHVIKIAMKNYGINKNDKTNPILNSIAKISKKPVEELNKNIQKTIPDIIENLLKKAGNKEENIKTLKDKLTKALSSVAGQKIFKDIIINSNDQGNKELIQKINDFVKKYGG